MISKSPISRGPVLCWGEATFQVIIREGVLTLRTCSLGAGSVMALPGGGGLGLGLRRKSRGQRAEEQQQKQKVRRVQTTPAWKPWVGTPGSECWKEDPLVPARPAVTVQC